MDSANHNNTICTIPKHIIILIIIILINIKLTNGQMIKDKVQGEGNERNISNRVLKAVQTCHEISAQW